VKGTSYEEFLERHIEEIWLWESDWAIRNSSKHLKSLLRQETKSWRKGSITKVEQKPLQEIIDENVRKRIEDLSRHYEEGPYISMNDKQSKSQFDLTR